MNWAIPWAPAGETANGLKFDSAISCAASSAAETFQRAAARSSGARKRAGTKAGRPAAAGGGAVAARSRADRVAGRRAGRRAGVEAVVPGLPGVALDEAEAARRWRPASRRRRRGPRSSSVAQRCSEWPGGATQLRVGVGGEERRLLGVGAEAGVDDEGDARRAAAAAAMRSKAAATSGRMPSPWR